MRATQRGGFTLVELLVVIGIIALLMGMLLPSLNRAQMQAQSIACRSNLRQCGSFMLMYANDNHGWMFPPGRGAPSPLPDRWPNLVFQPARPDPPVMVCPADKDMGPADLQVEDHHSYLLNMHMVYDQITYTRNRGVSPSEIVVMGEKKNNNRDYYMEVDFSQSPPVSDYDMKVETQRHGITNGSNLLYLDGRADNTLYVLEGGIDPWDIVP